MHLVVMSRNYFCDKKNRCTNVFGKLLVLCWTVCEEHIRWPAKLRVLLQIFTIRISPSQPVGICRLAEIMPVAHVHPCSR